MGSLATKFIPKINVARKIYQIMKNLILKNFRLYFYSKSS